jgi:hypothetical protein
MRRKQKKLSPIAFYFVSPEFVRLMVKVDTLMLVSLIILSQTT